ncbi:interleukin-6 receptor subunit beta [Centroberyx affinis]|uniref:interleukin-6 receptor subunit beta n=1 Tax=Centroberyx affinis TaxID=166261 RepID=UPI003A5BAB08
MVSQKGLLQLLAWTCLAFSLPASGEYDSHVMIAPQSPVVEIGSNFTAMCVLINTSEATADDLCWRSSDTLIPKEQYTKINESAVNVTITITSETHPWLFCECKKESSPYVMMHQGKFIHGIILEKGYPPEKPENLSCVAVQEKSLISPQISCTWEPGTRGSKDVITNYTLNVAMLGETQKEAAKQNKNGIIKWGVFPNHMRLDIWVEAENKLGKVESEHLIEESEWFVKTNPPTDMKVIPEKDFPTSLLMKWTRPIAKEYVKLMYQIRFCSNGSPTWTNVPSADIGKEIQSFRLQYLQPDTVYVTQVRCKHLREGYGYWSNWSTNATARTPEDIPKSRPDLWRVITPGDSRNKRRVKLICKDPVLSNGKIRSFDIRVQGTEWESILINSSDSDYNSNPRKITVLREIDLSDRKMAYIEVRANNSVGKSPKAVLVISKTAHEPSPVEGLKWWTHTGQLWLEWQPPNITPGRDAHRCNVTEYIVEWTSGWQMDWQREHGNITKTTIRGSLEKFKRYNISVYPLYCGWTGKQVTQEAFLEQGVPLEGPSVRLNGKPGSNEAELVWKEIPQDKQHGFITNYTIFYSTGTEEHAIAVSADTYSYLLKPLSSDTKYMAWIGATTIQGSVNGTEHSFSTLKYAPGEIEGIVVGVCFGFLFFVLLAVLLCIYKKDSIKKNFWPQIPNPGNSSIGTWSPDFPSKADTPKENALADVSVVEVDMFDGKSVFEEDKASLPLKKDKYLSEEHSSGIGGSSCMSSPRQSVSDSDEGGDSSETTASTVQYSSVVASNGYKGQTPTSLPQQPTFSRSESTQPLLDSEENPDMLGQEGSRQSHRFSRNPCFRRSPGNEDSTNSADFNQLEMEDQEGLVSLRFCPLEEGSQQTTPTEEGQSSDWQQSEPVSSYMPQLGGYRPQ